MKVKKRIAAWVGVLCLWSGSAWAADWHVATNGSDLADGTSWSTAKLTIQAGVDGAADGDTVWVSNACMPQAVRRWPVTGPTVWPLPSRFLSKA